MKNLKPSPMVGWYNPIQLASTAVDVLISTIFGRNADKRILQALSDTGDLQKKFFYEALATAEEDFWFDYIADVGDGFDSTYTMAYNISRPTLSVSLDSGEEVSQIMTSRGKVLIFGGDEVYPVASREAYQNKLTSLYENVFPRETVSNTRKTPVQPPAVFAIPGNHDWYDSLISFSELFCSQGYFGGWKTYQNRSYFAIKLPKGWWIFGTDMQLGSSLDKAQVAYFSKVMQHVGDNDRIILCNAEPHWITEKMYSDDPAYNNRNMGFFEGHVLNGKTVVYVAGDRHYYKRHEEIVNGNKTIDPNSDCKVQKIVAGGGGAFLHPTHNENVQTVGKRHIFELRKVFPSENVSKRLAYWILLFPLWNWKFILLAGFLYLLTAQAYLTSLGPFDLTILSESVLAVARATCLKPLALFWTIVIVGAFVFFTDPHSKAYRFIAGPIHAAIHLMAVFFIGWIVASQFLGGGQDFASLPLASLYLMGLGIFISGGVVGSAIMGLYLFISLNIFGFHHNEAFSSIRIADFKNFLRFKIDASTGDLTIFPIGVKKVLKRQEFIRKHENGHDFDVGKAFLIEEPIGVKLTDCNVQNDKSPKAKSSSETDSSIHEWNLDAQDQT